MLLWLTLLVAAPDPATSEPLTPNSPTEQQVPAAVTPTSPRRPRAYWMTAENPRDVALVPINSSAGVSVVADRDQAGAGIGLGLEVFAVRWSYLSVTLAEMRVQLYRRKCGEGGGCGMAADFNVGPRLGLGIALEKKRRHMLHLTSGLGWGTVGQGWGGRDPTKSGLVVSPGIRYTFLGSLGVELVAHLPGYDVGGPYPGAVALNVVGFPLGLMAISRGGRRFP